MTRSSCTCSHSRVAAHEPLPSRVPLKEGRGYEHVGTFQTAACPEDKRSAMADVSELDGGSFRMTSSSNPVVKAQAVCDNCTADQPEKDLPSLDLSSNAAVVVPAMSLSIAEHDTDVICMASTRRQMPRADLPALVPEVIATPVEATHTCCMYECDNAASNRPEFLSATIVRKSVDQKFGITFFCYKDDRNGKKRFGFLRGNKKKQERRNRLPRISGLHEEGLLSQAPFCVGDLLVSINKQSCQGKSPQELTEWLSNLTGTITLVVRHPGGDSSLVESCLLKPSPASKTGVSLNYNPRHNRLRVKQVHYEGLLVDGLLQVEDRIVAINHIPCRHWDAQAAAEQIAQSPLWVSIVAHKHQNAGVVLTVQDEDDTAVGETKTWYAATRSHDPRARFRLLPRSRPQLGSRSFDPRARLRLIPGRRPRLTQQQLADQFLRISTENPISSTASF